MTSEKQKIITLWESGMTVRQIRQLMAMPVKDFNRAMRELKEGGELPPKKTGRDKVAEAYARGERNPYVIAEMYGLSLQTVKSYKRQCGIKIGRRGKRNYVHSERTNAIYADLQLGSMTVAQVAKKHGVSWTYVKRLKVKLMEDGAI